MWLVEWQRKGRLPEGLACSEWFYRLSFCWLCYYTGKDGQIRFKIALVDAGHNL